MRRLPGLRLPCCVTAAVAATAAPLRGQVRLSFPDGRNEVTMEIHEGRLTYRLVRDGRTLLLPSRRGMQFRGAAPLRDRLRITDTTRQTHEEWWT